MKNNAQTILLVIAVFSLLISGAGCEGDQGPAGPAGPAKLSIVGTVTPEWDGDIVDELYVSLGVSNAPSIPIVKVNNSGIPLYDSWIEYGGRIGYQGNLYSETGFEEASLEVTYTKLNGNEGVATSTILLPEETVADDDDIQIYPGNDVEASWSSSDNADAYWVQVDFYVRYYDAASVLHRKDLEFDTVLTDTTITIPSEDFMPASYASIYSSDGTFYIYPVTGPWMPGVSNNIEGDGIGVFIGMADYEYVDVDINSVLSPNENEEDRDTEHTVDIRKIAEELAGLKHR
ncbi:MAG TPA: hypothetical protein VKO43_03545 [Candidatus Krumholzibacteriaceae bacterium]|nr:hypothetical protein [Candidatus Krumholzibacteriaceae bacterium]